MGYLILFLSFIAGCYLLFRKRVDFVFYILFLQIFLIFAVNKVQPNLTGLTRTFISFLVVVMFVYLLFVKRKFNRLQFEILLKFLCLIALTLTYLVASAWIKDIDPIIYLKFIKNRFWFLIIFFFLIFTIGKNNKNKLINSILVILFIEAGIGLLQHFGPREFFDFFIMKPYINSSGNIIHLVAEKNVITGAVETGTLGRINDFTNIVSLLTVYMFFILFNTKEMNKQKKTLIAVAIAVGITAIILSGIKASVVSLVIGLFLVIFFKNRIAGCAIITVCIVLLSVYSQFLYIRGLESFEAIKKNRKVSTFTDPIERLASIFVLLQDPSNLDDKTPLTLRRTFALASYFPDSPILGSDRYWKSGYGECYHGSSTFSASDAFFMLNIVEFGLLGAIIFLSPYLLTISMVKKYGNKKAYVMIRIIFLVLILQTVTDLGLFQRTANMLFFIFAGVEINLSRKKFARQSLLGELSEQTG